jgi:hypothetical protein
MGLGIGLGLGLGLELSLGLGLGLGLGPRSMLLLATMLANQMVCPPVRLEIRFVADTQYS